MRPPEPTTFPVDELRYESTVSTSGALTADHVRGWVVGAYAMLCLVVTLGLGMLEIESTAPVSPLDARTACGVAVTNPAGTPSICSEDLPIPVVTDRPMIRHDCRSCP